MTKEFPQNPLDNFKYVPPEVKNSLLNMDSVYVKNPFVKIKPKKMFDFSYLVCDTINDGLNPNYLMLGIPRMLFVETVSGMGKTWTTKLITDNFQAANLKNYEVIQQEVWENAFRNSFDFLSDINAYSWSQEDVNRILSIALNTKISLNFDVQRVLLDYSKNKKSDEPDWQIFLEVVGEGMLSYISKKISEDPNLLLVIESLGGYFHETLVLRYLALLKKIKSKYGDNIKATGLALIGGLGVKRGLLYRFYLQEQRNAQGSLYDPRLTANRGTHKELNERFRKFMETSIYDLRVDYRIKYWLSILNEYKWTFEEFGDLIKMDNTIGVFFQDVEKSGLKDSIMYPDWRDIFKDMLYALGFGSTSLVKSIESADLYNSLVDNPSINMVPLGI